MNILLTNDDGYQAEGLKVLEETLLAFGHKVWVCAPFVERSGQSHAMTLKDKVTFTRYDEYHYYCSGTPADCVLYGVMGKVVDVEFDLIVSGINHDYNASTGILYSGTVGAAREATLRNHKAIAISAHLDEDINKFPFKEAATFLAENLEEFMSFCTPNVLLNINVPPKTDGRWEVADVGHLEFFDVIEKGNATNNKEQNSGKVDNNGLYIGSSLELKLNYGSGDLPRLIGNTIDVDLSILNKGIIAVSPLYIHPVIDHEVAKKLKEYQRESNGS